MLSVHNVRLIPLSPLHIGGRFQALLPFEYIVGERFLVIREDKLGGLLQRRGLMSDFLQRFGAGFSLASYLRARGLLSSQLLEELTLYSCGLACQLPAGKQVRPFTRDAWQRPYIPGTAIKGAMRTALWYYAVRDNQDLIGKVRDAVESPEGGRSAKKVDDELDKEIFEGYRLGNAKFSPNTDILRVLKVSDAAPWERDSLSVGWGVTMERSGERADLSTYLEFLPKGRETFFQITFDSAMLEEFKKGGKPLLFGNLDELLAKVDGFYREVARRECKEGEEKAKERYQCLLDKTKGEGYLIRIGWGGGLTSLTIWLALPPDLRGKVREKFFRRSHRERFPLTRRFLKRKEGGKDSYTPFGWAILKI